MNKVISKLFFASLFFICINIAPRAAFAAATPLPEEQAAPKQPEAFGSLLTQIKSNPELLRQCIEILELRADVFFKCIHNSCVKHNLAIATGVTAKEISYDKVPFHPLFNQMQHQIVAAQTKNIESFNKAECFFEKAEKPVQKFINLLEEFATKAVQQEYQAKHQTHPITHANLLATMELEYMQIGTYDIRETLKLFNFLEIMYSHNAMFSTKYTQTMQGIYSYLKLFQSPKERAFLFIDEINLKEMVKIVNLLEKAHTRNILDTVISKLFENKKDEKSGMEIGFLKQAGKAMISFETTGNISFEQIEEIRTAFDIAKNAPQTPDRSEQHQKLRQKITSKKIDERAEHLKCINKYLLTLDEIIEQIKTETSGWSQQIVNQILFIIEADKVFSYGNTALMHYLFQINKKTGTNKNLSLFTIERLNSLLTYFRAIACMRQEEGCEKFEQNFKQDLFLGKIAREKPIDLDCGCKKHIPKFIEDPRSIDEILKDLGEPTSKAKKSKKQPGGKQRGKAKQTKPQAKQKPAKKSKSPKPASMQPSPQRTISNDPVLTTDSQEWDTVQPRRQKTPKVVSSPSPTCEEIATEKLCEFDSALLSYMGTISEEPEHIDETCIQDAEVPDKNCILDLHRGTLYGHHIKIFVYPVQKSSTNYLLNLDCSRLQKMQFLRDNNHAFSQLVEHVYGGCSTKEVIKLENDPEGFNYKIRITIPGRISSLFYNNESALLDGPTGEFEFVILKYNLDPNSYACCIHRFFRPFELACATQAFA